MHLPPSWRVLLEQQVSIRNPHQVGQDRGWYNEGPLLVLHIYYCLTTPSDSLHRNICDLKITNPDQGKQDSGEC